MSLRFAANRCPHLLYLAALLFGITACNSTPGVIERVPIPPGSSVRVAAESLAAHGVITSKRWFRVRARFAGIDRTVKAGIYELHRGAGAGVVLRAFRNGSSLHFRVVLPAGGTIFDLARNAHERLGLPPESLLAAARDTALLDRYHVDGPSIDGWLLPQSFDFGGFDTPNAVIARFAQARQESWDSTWDARAAAAHLTRTGLLVLASIVEAEAKDPAERSLIAAVYRNRLRLRMPLQADPTIQYAYLLRDGERKGRLFNGDYKLNSPWNTYLHPGLPPGPVGNPSREAIVAVLEPAPVSFLYFVAGPDGKSLFATTYAEQLRNIRKVRAAGAAAN